MVPINNFNVAQAQVSIRPASALKIEGLFLGTTVTRYLQVHDSVAAPADGAVPLKEWPLNPSTEFYKEFKPNGATGAALAFSFGLYICVSNTSGTKTLSADTMNVSVELDQAPAPTDVIIAGSLNTLVNSLQVWADAAGPKYLVTIIVDGRALTIPHRIYLYAIDNPNTAVDLPIKSWPIKVGELKVLPFGSGYVPGSGGNDGNLHRGCTVALAAIVGNNDQVAIFAEYK